MRFTTKGYGYLTWGVAVWVVDLGLAFFVSSNAFFYASTGKLITCLLAFFFGLGLIGKALSNKETMSEEEKKPLINVS